MQRTDNHGTTALLAARPVDLDFSNGLPPSVSCSYFATAAGWRYDESAAALYEYKLVSDEFHGKTGGYYLLKKPIWRLSLDIPTLIAVISHKRLVRSRIAAKKLNSPLKSKLRIATTSAASS